MFLRILNDNTETDGGKDGSLEFEFRGYYYTVGTIDEGDGYWMQRQRMDSYLNQEDEWEEAIWVNIGEGRSSRNKKKSEDNNK